MNKKKQKLLWWSIGMFLPTSATAILMYLNLLNYIIGGVIFVVLMGATMYGDYRITRKPKEVKENGL